MNCPKCGFAQEQRLDCKKCGVVFSKYYALYPSTKPAAKNELEDPIEQKLLEREQKNAIADLQLQIRELNARFEEIEFEKAERSRLRTDLENLERQLHENLDLTSSRLEEFERCFSSAQGEFLDPSPPSADEGLETREERVEAPGDEDNELRQLQEKDDENTRSIQELKDQLSELRGQLGDMHGLLQQLQQNRMAEERQGMFERDVQAIRENLDQLFRLITSPPHHD